MRGDILWLSLNRFVELLASGDVQLVPSQAGARGCAGPANSVLVTYTLGSYETHWGKDRGLLYCSTFHDEWVIIHRT